MKILNLTPHPVTIINPSGSVTITPEGGPLPRLVEETTLMEWSLDRECVVIPITHVRVGSVENLPDVDPDTMLIVSQMVCRACPDRPDLLFPYPVVRDDMGRIVGCEGLAFA